MSISESVRCWLIVLGILLMWIIASTMEGNDLMSTKAHGATLPQVKVTDYNGETIGYTFDEVRFDRAKNVWLVELFNANGGLEEKVAEIPAGDAIVAFTDQTCAISLDGHLVIESKGWEVDLSPLDQKRIVVLRRSDMTHIEAQMPQMP